MDSGRCFVDFLMCSSLSGLNWYFHRNMDKKNPHGFKVEQIKNMENQNIYVECGFLAKVATLD